MGAPIGNSFWLKRSKSGREKIFDTPNSLWESACEYFTECDKNPWIRKDWVGKDAIEVERETQRPYTQKGLCLFLDIDESTLDNYASNEIYKDFFPIVSRIKNIIYTCKFEGALVGTFNANLVARELGLAENIKTDIITVVIPED